MDRTHDKNSTGFDIDPVQLEHDLAMLRLSKSFDFSKKPNVLLYEAYLKELEELHGLIEDKTRYDSTYNK